MGLNPGTVIGPYEVGALIGRGGMGEVYSARDVRLDRTVAIKILPAALADDASARVRFEREARAVAALNHPHICTLYDVSSDYLVMELVDGQPLAGPLPLARALELAAQILSALDAAHRKGITHRDLKPGNILVTKQGVKLLDFGLAKVATQAVATSTPQTLADVSAELPTGQQALTSEHMLLGTVHYMSPEQVQGEPADARSDIFSFGLVLYEMLTGKRAFDGPNPASVIAAILERDAPSAVGVAPPALDWVLQRCLAKDPDERWQSARDVSHALALVRAGAAGTGPIVPRRRALAVASLVGLLAAVAIAVLFWRMWPRPQGEGRPLSFNLTPPAETQFQFSPSEGGSAISPDGQSVAFVAVTKGTPRLWIRLLSSLIARELPDTEGARLPFWSPDSGAIGFFTGTDLRSIDVTGAAAVRLARVLDPRGGTWNADGTIVFSSSIGPLYRVSASGGTPSSLTTLPAGQSSHRWPKFLPDGRTLLYFVQGADPGVYLTTLDRPGDTRRIFSSLFAATYVPGRRNSPGYLLWVARDTVMAQRFDPSSAQLVGSVVAVPGTGGVASSVGTQRTSLSISNDGTLLYSSGASRFQLGWFERDGTPRGTVGAIEQYIGLRISPDGRDVLVTITEDTAGSGDLWRIDLASGTRSRITSGGGGWYAVWSPDGQQVAFSAFTGRERLQTTNARGSGEVQNLLTFESEVYPSDWSFDGRYLAYTTNRQNTSNDIWLLSLMETRKPAPLLRSLFSERHAQFSPDAKWLAFTSNEAGRDNVYVQSFPGAAVRRIVSSTGGAFPRWGARGNELFYRAPDGRLTIVPVRFVGGSVELGPPSLAMRLEEPAGIQPYPFDVAADGRILALTPAVGNVQNLTLTVLMNWQAALER